jgi:hypothetical protein
MRTDKLAVIATVLAVGYLMFKEKGAPSHPTLPAPAPITHPTPRRPPFHFPPILGHPFPHPTPRRPPPITHPTPRRPPFHFPPILGHPFPHPTPRRPPFE